MKKINFNKTIMILMGVIYIALSFVAILNNTKIDDKLDIGTQYGIMFVIHTLSVMIVLFISVYFFVFVFRFIVDTKYDNLSEMYFFLVFANIINTVVSIANRNFFRLIDTKISSILGVIIVDVFMFMHYYRTYMYNKRKLYIFTGIMFILQSTILYIL
ncbi:hypothetical protein [Gemella cuniculi]|uniref:hypothetical protein n=1 Tax=Gemella cuniculi TaxID=150240 RepID=UPI00040502C3|nr:hypothetical protein [Gemella cuniculi]